MPRAQRRRREPGHKTPYARKAICHNRGRRVSHPQGSELRSGGLNEPGLEDGEEHDVLAWVPTDGSDQEVLPSRQDQTLEPTQALSEGRTELLGYEWQPLASPDHIRLLTIFQAPKYGDSIECSITAHTLDPALLYQALSYTWGDPTLTKAVLCDDKVLKVTANCEAAIRALRSPVEDVCVWIDAICINQTDIAERNQQVSRMGDIYRHARETVIHLPPEDAASQLACESIHMYEHWDSQVGWPVLNDYAAETEIDSLVERWEMLFRRRWFSRTWVLQEILLSSHLVLIIGTTRLPWSVFDNFITPERRDWDDRLRFRHSYGKLLSDHMGWENVKKVLSRAHRPYILGLHAAWSPELRKPADTSRLFSGTSQSAHTSASFSRLNWTQFIDLLVCTRSFECKDPRDKIYALLSLFKPPRPDLRHLLVPDYLRPIEEVYADVSLYLLQHNASIALSLAGLSRSTPSWAVDWREVPAPAVRRTLDLHNAPDLAWSAGMPQAISRSGIKRVDGSLMLHGRIVDTVVSLTRHSLLRDGLGSFPASDQVADTMDSVYKTFHDDEEAMLSSMRAVGDEVRAILRFDKHAEHALSLPQGPGAGFRNRRVHQPRHNESQLQYRQLLESLQASSGLAPADVQTHALGGERVVNVFTGVVGQEVIMTRYGLEGLAPPRTKPGDSVCILLGFKTPFLLRPRQEGKWELVGECFVDGIMQGEAVTSLDWARVGSGKLIPPLREFRII